MQEHYIEYQESRLYYTVSGQGSVPLLLFHGFGQDHAVFKSWTESFAADRILYSFDLYFHGKSVWPEGRLLEKSDWQLVIKQFIEKEKIKKFEVAGFSLGGKFALSTLEIVPEDVTRLVLLAPDGINTSFWYSLATYPLVIRRLFKSMVLHPGRFYNLARFLQRLHLVDKGLIRFAEFQMDTETKRKRVYQAWVGFRHIKSNLLKIAGLMNIYQTPLLVFTGKFDKVIPSKNMDRLLKNVNQNQHIILDTGHNDLIEKSIEYLHSYMKLP